MRINRAALAASIAIAPTLSGCTVGPDYTPPALNLPARYDGPVAAPAAAEPDLSAWWRQFEDPVLDQLVDRALSQNLDLESAAARLRAARLELAAARAAGKPTLGSSFGANTTRFSKNAGLAGLGSLFGGGQKGGSNGGVALPGESISTFSAGFDASWELDLFGGARRRREAAVAQAEASEWQVRDTEVAVIAELADDYLKLRAVQCEAAILADQRAAHEGLLRIAEAGTVSGVAAAAASYPERQESTAIRASIAANRAQQETLRRQIALLLAVPVSELPTELTTVMSCERLAVPKVGPGLPSELLRRRPDVRAAERNLAAATAQIGVATADLYPRFSLTGVAELLSTSLASLLSANSIETIASGSAAFPLIDFGRGRALVGVARAQADAAYLGYRKTVLTAFSEVGGALEQLATESDQLDARTAEMATAQKAQSAAQARTAAGLSDFAPVYRARIASGNAALDVLATQAAQREQLIKLYKALGGGWSDGTSGNL
jgi:NodT family efflux transporter outer membrane factor (OMF) lipoprotein